jgi:hypothetical protein
MLALLVAVQFLPTPPELEAKIKRVSQLGVAIYLLDQASAAGTDSLMEHVKPRDKDVGGYVTLRETDAKGKPLPSWAVSFYSKGEPPYVKYRIHLSTVKGKKPVFEAVNPPQLLPELGLTLLHARDAAMKAAGPFEQPVNPVMLPAGPFGEPGEILVELLASTEKADTVVLGRHFRVIIASDGKTVQSVTALSKKPLELSTLEEGKRVKELVTAQVSTDYPLETHVFASMLSGLPLLVQTQRGIWLVDRDAIHLLQP